MAIPANPSSENDIVAVYRQTVEALYGFVSRRCSGARELAEDVTQETYLRAVSTWSGGKTPDEPLAWLQTVARNLLLNYFRKKQPDSVDSASLDSFLDKPDANGVDPSAVVYWGLSRVSPKDASLLEAFYFEQQSGRTISERLSISERAVEGRLRRARRALRRVLRPYLEENGDLR